MTKMSSVLPPELAAVRDSVLYKDVGSGPFMNGSCAYCMYSPFFPNPFIAFPEVINTTVRHFYQGLPWNGLGEWFTDSWEYQYTSTYLTLANLGHILLMALLITIVRYIATEALLKKIPVWFNCLESEGAKFPEAAFRVLVYSLAWPCTVYIMFRHGYFYEPIKTIVDFVPGVHIPDDIYLLYVYELGLYVHSIYATLFIEVVRRDFVVQLIHHVLTICLLGYSLSIRLYSFGIIVLFMHDGGDALMETAKCCLYFKIRNGKTYKTPDMLANIFFGLFVLNWIIFRLYWLPVKAIYSTAHVTKCFLSRAPHYLFSNSLLVILYFLHWYWFYFIAKLVLHVVTGNDVVDNRDYEEEGDKEEGKETKKSD